METEMNLCIRCGNAEVTEEWDDKGYCDDCIEALTFLCDDCNERYDKLALKHEVHNGDIICDECYEDYYFTCDECGEIYYEGMVVNNGDIICDGCYEDYYFTCDECGEIYHQDNYATDGLCENCYEPEDENEDEETDHIHSYNYTPEYIFYSLQDKGGGFRQNNNLIYYGIELEIECPKGDRNDTASDILNLSDDEKLFYLKSDSTIHNGFEICTMPATLEYFKAKVSIKDICERLKKRNCKSHNTSTCGLHIHISRKLTRIQEIKLGIFVHTQIEKMEKFGRRKTNSHAKFKNIKKKGKDVYESVNPDDRYTAVNFANSHTIEFRLFKGTLKYETIIASLEFVDGLISFVTSGTIGLGKLFDIDYTWKEFVNHVRVKKYQQCIEYMENRNVIE